MASNEEITSYKNLEQAPDLDQKTLNKMAWRSCFLQASFNYERMQAAGWLYSILPGLEKIHTDKDDLSTLMTHNMEFFNIHPFLVTFAMGLILSMEQKKVDIPTIRAVRVSLMGPLGGIGDALFWMTLVPITAGICSNMAISGNAALLLVLQEELHAYEGYRARTHHRHLGRWSLWPLAKYLGLGFPSTSPQDARAYLVRASPFFLNPCRNIFAITCT